jgi:hypothetical protein
MTHVGARLRYLAHHVSVNGWLARVVASMYTLEIGQRKLAEAFAAYVYMRRSL